MAIDVSPVVAALEDAGSAVAVVATAVLLVVVAVACFRYLRLTIPWAGDSSYSYTKPAEDGSDAAILWGAGEDMKSHVSTVLYRGDGE